nr:hypothetical protein [Armatimonadota bacterium]
MKRFSMISTAMAALAGRRVKTGFAHRLIGVALCMFALASAGVGQVTEAWVARYNGPESSYDRAFDVAADAAGNVYVTGFS